MGVAGQIARRCCRFLWRAYPFRTLSSFYSDIIDGHVTFHPVAGNTFKYDLEGSGGIDLNVGELPFIAIVPVQ